MSVGILLGTLLGWAMPGPTEMVIVLIICLLLFGARRLPSLMFDMGRSLNSFKDGLRNGPDESDLAMDERATEN